MTNPQNSILQSFAFCALSAIPAVVALAVPAPAIVGLRAHPLMRDFMGLNTHTVGFKPQLYAPVCKEIRDYHPMDWDTGDNTSNTTKFPMTVNGVDWSELYGKWTTAGYDVDACVMFDNFPTAKWKNPADDAKAYGEAFAKFFGPSGDHKWVSSVEIGNEPGKYSVEQYRAIFDGMAHGLRAGDPKMKIATCAVMTGKPDQWSKPMNAIDGLNDLFDVVNVHSYAFKDAWPTWHRSYPEDSSITYLKAIDDVIQYRNAHFKGKEVWLTEFGYDSATKPPSPNGEWAKWVGVTDEQQAQWIVRSFLVLSAMDVDRAYLYFFDDKDDAQLHGASGITRNYKPKPSFYAMSHLYKTLGDYRFVKATVKKEGELYCFEYDKPAPSHERVFVAWSPTGEAKPAKKILPIGTAAKGIYRAEKMPQSPDAPEAVEWKATATGVEVEVGNSPVYLWIK